MTTLGIKIIVSLYRTLNMKEVKGHIDDLIVDYLTGSLPESAMSELKEWIKASPENKKYFLQQSEIWFSTMNRKLASRYDKDKAFEIFKERLERDRGRGRFFKWYYISGIVVIFMISVISYWLGEVNLKKNFEQMVVEAPLGSRTKLYLPDGTLVWLNAGTKMVYSQGFGVDNREVILEGEGYFEVVKNKEIPFLIKTKELDLRVLGTKFNFRDYPEDKEVVVSLLEGKVELDNLLNIGNKNILKPNERALLNKQTGKMEIESVTASNASEWTDGYLFFNEELLPDIVRELERSYNVKIQLADTTLNSFRFYGNFTRREQTIEEVMEVLSSTGKIKYKKEGREITIY